MMETRAALRALSLPCGLVFRTIARGPVFLWLPVFMAAGIGAYFSWPTEPDPQHLRTLVLAALALPFLASARVSLILPALFMAFAVLGFVLAAQKTARVAAPVLEYRYYGPIEGRIVGIDRSGSGKMRLTLDQLRLDRVAPQKRPERIRVSLHGEQPFLEPRPGTYVMMTGHVSPPSGPVEPGGFDFQRHAWFAQLGGVGYTRVPALRLAPAQVDSWSLRLFTLRMHLSDTIKARMPAREGGFAAAILTGDRSDVDADALQALRDSNLAHLLAISGLHMGLLTGVVFALIRVGFATMPSVAMRCDPKKIAAVLALITGMAYLAVSGANVATQRAFVMVAVMLVAICLDRRAITLRAVAVAALIILAVAPESLAGPGFQMSFAATTALVAVFAEIRDRALWLTWPRWARNVASLVISSAVAGLATAPFGALHFNQMAQWGLIANLLSVPVMGFVVMPGAVLAAILSLIGLEQVGIEVMRAGIYWILRVAETVAGWESALRHIPAPGAGVLPLLGLGGALLCLLRGTYGRLAGGAVLAAAFGLWSLSQRPAILLSDTGGLIGVMTPQGRALNKPRGDGFVAGAWLENDADPVTQEEASSRAEFTRNELSGQLDGETFLYLRDKEIEARDIPTLCRAYSLVILPEFRGEAPEAKCQLITGQTLRNEGAIAIDRDGVGWRIESANQRRGARPWVR